MGGVSSAKFQRASARMEAVQTPIIPAVAELIRQCPGTISLGQGVVYYPPPAEARDAIAGFFDDPQNHKYKPVQGTAELLALIAAKLEAENGIRAGGDAHIVVTAGGNMAFYSALLSIANAGDEVILQTPYYFNHEMAIAMADCRPVCVDTDANYHPRLDAIRAALTPRTRAVVTVSPNNPTGAVYPESLLREINALCAKAGVYHIHDEAYEYFVHGDCRHFSPGSIDGAAPHTISLYSLSKAFGMASWRVGYMVIPAHLMDAVKKAEDTIVICPPVISQQAALGAMRASRDWRQSRIGPLAEVRQLVKSQLQSLGDRIEIPPAEGAFYFLPRVHTALSPMAVVERLVREFGVAVIPGTTFGIEGHCALRVAYGALSKDTVAEGMGRLVKGLAAIV